MVDYSKWKNIEISDDEDDTHPNIDTASLFRWRHQARIEREQERKREKDELQKKKIENEQKIKDLEKKMKECAAENDGDGGDSNNKKSTLDEELKKLQSEKKELEKREQEINKAERNAPWNVDTISKEGWSKTVINKPKPTIDRSKLSSEEYEKYYQEFVKKHESTIKEFAMLSRFEDAKQFLQQHPDLVCEETSFFLTCWCLDLEIEGKHELMKHISKQQVSMSYILEIGQKMNMDPRGCVASFYNRISQMEQVYMETFDSDVKTFQERIEARAKQKIEEAMKECEEEERQKRLGPGGLDPLEVYQTLPKQLQECFDTKDVELLKKTIVEMDPEEATYHMKRCVDSGLWVPDKNSELAKKEGEEEEGQEQETTENTEEENYETIKPTTSSENVKKEE